mgnify:CR=1 FL=1
MNSMGVVDNQSGQFFHLNFFGGNFFKLLSVAFCPQ